jgi:hypothetical protein
MEVVMEIYELSDALLMIQADLRAEVVARELMDAGYTTLDDTVITPEGPFRRSYSRDVAGITEEFGALEHPQRFVRITTTREGIADMLPPGIFNQPIINREERSAEVMIREAEIYEKELRSARTFFLPLDIEFGRQRISMEQFEHQSVTDTFAHYNHDLFAYLWPELKLDLTAFQKTAILELTMAAHDLSGVFHESAIYMEKILGYPIEIRSGDVAGWIADEITDLAHLGSNILGVNWIPFEEYRDQECIKIIVGPVPVEEMIHFRHHEPIGKNYRILEFLCELLLPVEISWSMVLVPSDGNFEINTKKETALLGYSTILG